jgi:hypothetical protein
VGVGNLDTEGHALATIITLRHFIAPPIFFNHIRLDRRLDMISDFAKKCKHYFYFSGEIFKNMLILGRGAGIISSNHLFGRG